MGSHPYVCMAVASIAIAIKGTPASAKKPEPTHEGEPFDRLPPNLQQDRLWLDQKHWESFNPTTASPQQTLSWQREFLREFDEAKSNTSPVLGSLPVIVVSSNSVLGKSECLFHSTAAACLDFLSSNTVHITATGSGHEIHLYQPATLLRALSQAFVICEVVFSIHKLASRFVMQ